MTQPIPIPLISPTDVETLVGLSTEQGEGFTSSEIQGIVTSSSTPSRTLRLMQILAAYIRTHPG